MIRFRSPSSSSSIPADYVPAGHVIISADRYSEYADLSYRRIYGWWLRPPTHSAFIRAASSGSKLNYSNQQNQDMIYEDFDQVDQLEMEELDLKWQMAMLSLRINRFEKKAGRKMNYNNQQPARFDRRKVRCYKCLQLGHFARECNVKTVDDKARYSAFKVTEVKTDEPKALVSVDSMFMLIEDLSSSAGRPNPTGRVGQATHLAAAQSNPAGWSKRPAPVSAGRPVSNVQAYQNAGQAQKEKKDGKLSLKRHYDKSSDSETYASCDSSLKTKTKDFPPTVDIKTWPESDVEDPNSLLWRPSILLTAGSRNSPASVTAGGSDPAASRNRPAVNSADRPNPAGWSKRPATGSWDDGGTSVRPSRLKSELAWVSQVIVGHGCSRSMKETRKTDDFVRSRGRQLSNLGWRWLEYQEKAPRTSKLDFWKMSTYVEELQYFKTCSSKEFQCLDESHAKRHPWMHPHDMAQMDGSCDFKTITELDLRKSSKCKYYRTCGKRELRGTIVIPDPTAKMEVLWRGKNKNLIEVTQKLTLMQSTQVMTHIPSDEHVIVTEYEALRRAARYGYLFAQATAEILSKAEAKIRNKVFCLLDLWHWFCWVVFSAGSICWIVDLIGSHPAVILPTGSYETVKTLHDFQSLLMCARINSHLASSHLPLYDDDFHATFTNLTPAMEVNPVPTKRVNTIHPQSQILGDSVLWNKARLVAQGHRQEEGIDYDELDVKSGHSYEKLKMKCLSHLSLVYVDEIIFGSTNKAWCDEFEVLMKGGNLSHDQDKYVKDMLTKFDMESVRTATTPYEAVKTKLKDETDPPVNVHLYRSMIAHYVSHSFKTLTHCLHVSACSRHQVISLDSLLNACQKIFKYLKGPPKWLVLVDVKFWAGRVNFMAVQKQSLWATSSTEAVYVVLLAAVSQLVVILPAGCFVSDGSYGLCCWFRVHAGGHTSAGGFISAAGCVFLLSAWLLLLDDSSCWLNTFMLLNWFVLVVSCSCWLTYYFCWTIGFCWSYYDSAGSYPFCWTIGFCWSYYVSAGSLHSCWCNNVSAA
ncbi:ribonuclease H-like domain-containing protein [Tanacetum coccineum]